MPARFYIFSENICNACFKKHEKQKLKRRERTQEKKKLKVIKLQSKNKMNYFR